MKKLRLRKLAVVISSTAHDLPVHRKEVMNACLTLGHLPRMMEHLTAADAGAVDESLSLVDEADVYVGIFAHRYGYVPPGSEVSIVEMEYRRAGERGIPRLVFFMDDEHPIMAGDVETGDGATRLGRLKEEIRAERVVAFFKSPPDLRALVIQALVELQRPAAGEPPSVPGMNVCLRGWPELTLPEEPYPLLLPYTHPRLFAGRQREIDELRHLLRGPVPILLLHAPSGAGKSSLLRAGLGPALNAEGIPVAFDDHPGEADLGRRLVRSLLAHDDWPGGLPAFEETDVDAFVALVDEARLLAGGRAPVLLVDQFEDVFRRPQYRGSVGMLLAASIRHHPSVGDPALRWVLAYRQEFHGEVRAWLRDVLVDARRAGIQGLDRLPHDLSGIERSRDWPLPTFGTQPGGNPTDIAAAFRAAIDAPLVEITDEANRPRYALRFTSDGVAHLAAAFAESRAQRPEAPLVPELQVVLTELQRRAGDGPVEVPDDIGELIAKALENHLRVALDRAFPPTQGESKQTARTRALLGLRELADAKGRRGAGLPASELARVFEPDAEATLERLAAADTRLIVARYERGVLHYSLSHDRMAEVVVRIVEEEGIHAEIDVDRELLRLRRYVGLMTDLYHAGETLQATQLPARRYEAIQTHAEALLWDEDRQCWWQACQERQQNERTVLVAQLSTEVAPKALEALAALVISGADRDFIGKRLAERRNRRQLFEQGPTDLADHEREEIVLGAARNAVAYFEAAPDDHESLATCVWALDYFIARSEAAEKAASVRRALLEPLRRRRPPPELTGDNWAAIPAGSFDMGTAADEPGEDRERPQHRVTISACWMLVHPVTNRQFRRLIRDHPASDDLPVVNVNWYQAYAYAAWLGGRLPTEAEWEYAARAGCLHPYCDRHRNPTTLDKVGWYLGNSRGEIHQVKQLEPNPWGLYDLYGNVLEWVADWYEEYLDRPQIDPWGPPGGEFRVFRGGCFRFAAHWTRAANRDWCEPSIKDGDLGFRVVLPAVPNDAT